ncbi:MAG: NAD(+) synthase [Lachnospiraceae bacterium]|nr:NAD(+) synthase [Lachnospiraceae bacterium]
MKHGFVKVAAVTVPVKVADPKTNAESIKEKIKEAAEHHASVIVCQELCITAYTCQDLFYQGTLLDAAKDALFEITDFTKDIDALVFVGLPLEMDGKLYNVAAAISRGEILALIPKRNLPTYNEFYEKRQFTEGPAEPVEILLGNSVVPFGSNILLECNAVPGLVVAAEICEDAWVPDTPSTAHALAGATLIVNLSASTETIGKADYRKMLIKSLSGRLVCGYVYATAGEGESSQDLVFGSHNMIAEYGSILNEGTVFGNEIVYADVDIERLRMERRRVNTFVMKDSADYLILPFALEKKETPLERKFYRQPFVPASETLKKERCELILSMQAEGLKQRLRHIGGKKIVLGLSGGLDSTLALLVCVKAFEELKLDPAGMIAITMPGFGTTGRTYQNACEMARCVGATLREISIKNAVEVHFEDIGQEAGVHDVTYENCQARERTQILMDVANKENAIVVGTGDMSELALGWATYNGDHMSMYGVNSGVPKTLVRHLVRFYSEETSNEKLSAVLEDVLNTPVSPELLPPKDGVIAQITEDVVGPYELHDFFLYYMLRCGYGPDKVYRIALLTFTGEDAANTGDGVVYDKETVLKWLKTFYRRFFSQQFKRSCLPDGVKIGSVAVSPRGDLRMPSDASARIWLDMLEDM